MRRNVWQRKFMTVTLRSEGANEGVSLQMVSVAR